MSLTSPLGLMRHVQRPDLRLEIVPWLNVLMVGALLSLLGSSYIYAPGLTVDTSVAANLPQTLNLPQIPDNSSSAGNSNPLPGRTIDAVLEAQPRGQSTIFILNGGFHYLADLPKALQNLRKNIPGKNKRPMLLFKGNREVSYDTFLQVCAIAGALGFDVQGAAIRPTADAPASPADAAATPPTSPAATQ